MIPSISKTPVARSAAAASLEGARLGRTKAADEDRVLLISPPSFHFA